jgi:protein MAK11
MSEPSAPIHNKEQQQPTIPDKIVLCVGTYDGVIAGWEFKKKKRPRLDLLFASPVHNGSVRCLALAQAPTVSGPATHLGPGSLLSCGFDEVLRTHDLHRNLTSSGEVKLPSTEQEFHTPVCASFAPPPPSSSSHCIVGFSGGKLVIYKKRDWSVQHVLAGHEGGVATLAVHPTGKLALTGGCTDGRIKLWDLTRGRLAFCTRLVTAKSAQKRYCDPVVSLVWSQDGTLYGWAHGSHVTVRHATSGKDLLDVELPTRVNQLCFLQGPDGIFVAVAGNDGSLPVLEVHPLEQESDSTEIRRAIMAIEPVEGPIAGEERLKCIHTVTGYCVVTANSAGVVSLMDLSGAIGMITVPAVDSDDNSESDSDGEHAQPNAADDDVELAVDILASAQLGTGARVTCLVAWACAGESSEYPNEDIESVVSEAEEGNVSLEKDGEQTGRDVLESSAAKRKRPRDGRSLQEAQTAMSSDAVARARALVAEAKKIQRKNTKKKNKKRQKLHEE